MGKRSRSRERRRRGKSRDRSSKRKKHASIETRLDNLEKLLHKVICPNSSESSAQGGTSQSQPPSFNSFTNSVFAVSTPPATPLPGSTSCSTVEPTTVMPTNKTTTPERQTAVPDTQAPTQHLSAPQRLHDVPATSHAPVVVCSATQGQINKLLTGSDNIPAFTGNVSTDKMTAQKWIKRLEALAKIFGWDERFIIYQMTSKLSGNARLWFDAQQEIDFSWDEWKKKIMANFPEGRGIASKLYDFVTVMQENNENVLDFYYKKITLGKKCDQPDHVIADVIIFLLKRSIVKDWCPKCCMS